MKGPEGIGFQTRTAMVEVKNTEAIPRVLIMGVGNLLMGDEGVGDHVIRRLEREQLPAYVDLLDGGTGGFHLLSYLQDYSEIIMIDATMDGNQAGTIRILRPRFASDFPRTLAAHDIGLRDLVEAASLLGDLGNITLIAISIASVRSMELRLSPEVEKSVELIPELVMSILEEKGRSGIAGFEVTGSARVVGGNPIDLKTSSL